MDPRFKGKLECAADAAWGRLEKAAVCNLNVQMESLQNIDEEGSDDPDEKKAEEHSPSHKKRAKKSALEEMFEDEDQELLQAMTTKKGALSKAEPVQKEIELYRGLSSNPSGQDPVAWWWGKRDSLPILSALSNTYLCVQASSTPSERVFSCAGHAISQERIFVPSSLRSTLFQYYHSTPICGHGGIYKTYKRLQEVAFWPGMWSAVKQYSATAKNVASIFRKDILTRWGVPDFVLSDRGAQFV
nr:uncharacterized protein LOC129424319 [Misgurnus anguillicaudatus]